MRFDKKLSTSDHQSAEGTSWKRGKQPQSLALKGWEELGPLLRCFDLPLPPLVLTALEVLIPLPPTRGGTEAPSVAVVSLRGGSSTGLRALPGHSGLGTDGGGLWGRLVLFQCLLAQRQVPLILPDTTPPHPVVPTSLLLERGRSFEPMVS